MNEQIELIRNYIRMVWRQRWRASGYQGGTALLAQDEKTMLNELLRIVV